MKKYFFVVFGLISTALLVLLAYFFFSRVRAVKVSTITSSRGGLIFETASDYDDIKLGIKDEQILFKWLDHKGILKSYLENGVVGFGETQPIHPKKIKVLLTKERQSFYKLMTEDNNGPLELRSYGTSYENSNEDYVLKVYVDRQLLELMSTGEVSSEEIINSYILTGIYATSVSGSGDSMEIAKNFPDLDKELREGKIFPFEIKTSPIKILLNLPQLNLVKSANAQVCTGTPRSCGTIQSWLLCSEPGNPCFVDGAQCGVSGVCDWTTPACIEDFYRQCQVRVSPFCQADGCGAASCGELGAPNCYWTAGPTPTPEPPPPGCNCTGWADQACGAAPCNSDERLQSRSCDPVGCDVSQQCVADVACAPPSCTISFNPEPINVAAGDTATVTANVVPLNGTVDRVDFVIGNSAIATIAPNTDNLSPYQTVVTGVAPNTTELRATAYMGGVATCGYGTSLDPDPAPVIVSNPGAWWQVIDSDVITNGDVVSPIPGTCSGFCDNVFVVDRFPDSPGVPLYGQNYDFNSGVGQGTVSDTGWHVNANYSAITEYKYAFYERLIPGDTIRNPIAGSTIGVGLLTSGAGSVSPDGYKWFFREGDVRLNRQGLTTNKIILFVNGNLTIDGEITLDDGRGFFMAIVKGNITIDPNINVAGSELEGIFVTDQTFITAADDDQLHIRGMVAAYNANSSGPIIMGRNLADNTQTAAEIFEYAPDLLFNYPSSLTLKRTRWKEITP